MTARCRLAGLASTGDGGLERGERKRQHPAGGRRVDRAGRRGQAPPGEDLHEHSAERVPDERRLAVQPLDDHLLVGGHVADALAGEHLRVGVRLLHRQRVVRPAGGDGHVAGVLEERRPPVPAGVQQPQPVHEHHRLLARGVRPVDLRQLARRRGGVRLAHGSSSWSEVSLEAGHARATRWTTLHGRCADLQDRASCSPRRWLRGRSDEEVACADAAHRRHPRRRPRRVPPRHRSGTTCCRSRSTFTAGPGRHRRRVPGRPGGPVNFSSARSSANALAPHSALVRRDHDPQVFLAVQVAGTTVIEQAGNQAVLRPGDMTIYDSTRPYTVRTGADRAALLPLPRDALALPQHRSTRCSACGSAPTPTRWPPPWRLLHHPGRLVALDRPAPRRGRRAGIQLVRALLAAHAGDDGLAREPLRRLPRVAGAAVRARPPARARPDAGRGSPRPTTSRCATSTRTSPGPVSACATASRSSDSTRAGANCATPASRNLAVATIGARWGFVDPSHFSRVFKAGYGMTPHEWRTGSGDRAVAPADKARSRWSRAGMAGRAPPGAAP